MTNLRDIFEKPVDRAIEGVIKADDEASLRVELEEYVITNEIERQLEKFLDAYNNYETANGVWISGFFGSGKSHLLKMLALLLENRDVGGTPAYELFKQKCADNEILAADLRKAVSIPSRSILFNIDQKADVISKEQIDALLSVFQKVFDEMCGFYGKQPHIAQFERDLDSRGVLENFQAAYQAVAGKPWERGREQALLESANVAKAYAEATGADPSAAQGILTQYRQDFRSSIEDFADKVKAYVDAQQPGFRLNFFVDEVGQYIADNVKLMTNLQTIAESLNTKCRGRAWIIVTAQQDMGAVIGDMTQRQENDFSKIQARFANRMPLNSADVAEVIQKRLLKKTEAGVLSLTDLYHREANNLKTLFDFSDGSMRLENFRDRDHFIHSYPFLPYQYPLFQQAILNLSQHNAFEGKHSSVGERSMLGVFQEVAVRLADIPVGGVATFDQMFEGIRTALKSNVQQSILIAEKNLGDEFATRVLKALFLVKYVKGFKPTARNISILMLEWFDDYTELLLPEDLLSNASILAYTREAMTPDACEDVEVIGWLYQFYISEKKDEVFAGLKKNVKITVENIPAATQLFTPHWIVRYLVENSLGRLWLLNRPSSRLKERMDYYIAPEVPETEFPRITAPEEIKVCDPACGSGHMLIYAFDILHAIYDEEGYDPPQIPALILKHNLTGLEIDDRAGALAAFALAMKAAARLGRRRFLRMEVKPDIVALQNVTFTPAEMTDVATVVGQDLFTDELRETLTQFEQAKNFGSLIVPTLSDPAETLRVVKARDFGGDLLLKEVQDRVVAVLRVADALSPKYHVVVANPPYMGGKGMNAKLDAFAKENYEDSKSDLFAMFIERSTALTVDLGYVAMITMQSWMFLSRHQKLREKIIAGMPIRSMAHLGTGAFDSIGGEVVSTTAFVLAKNGAFSSEGSFVDLRDGRSEAIKAERLRSAALGEVIVKHASSETFQAIDGQPIAHWVSEEFRSCFTSLDAIKDVFKPAVGLNTGDNDRFLKQWFEVDHAGICFSAASIEDAARRTEKWFPYNKGGGHRKWYGNQSHILNWQNDGEEVKGFATQRNKGKHWSRYIQNLDKMFLECVTWSDISTSSFAARLSPAGFLFDVKGSSGVPHQKDDLSPVLSLLCSNIMPQFMQCVNPTSTFQVGDLARVPYTKPKEFVDLDANEMATVRLAKSDWDAFETSWDFTTLPLLSPNYRAGALEAAYAHLRQHWQSMTDEMQRLEEGNNRIFIDAYGLQGELTPEVPIEEITLTCNPAYRYGGGKTEIELETLLRADTVREFLSYAVGCMFGRYSLDAPGLILANPGEGIQEYLAKVPEPTFPSDADNVIPMLDGEWFADDITERFRKFLRVTFSEAHFQENLAFIEDALGKKLRSYFTRDFYADHVRRYKKRPIYWLFSSPKGSFNALIYLHRYRPDTVSVVLNDYLREFRSKLEGHRRGQEALSISGEASPAQKTKALKEIEATARQIEEIDVWERDVLFPLATQKIELDLDDGVKANYPKFGAALKPIKGLSDADD